MVTPQENERRNRINALVKVYVKAEKLGKELDASKVISECMAKYGVSKRTAQEYIDAASYAASNQKGELNGE